MKTKVSYSIGFDSLEREELLEILKSYPIWVDRIQKAHGILIPEDMEEYIKNLHEWK